MTRHAFFSFHYANDVFRAAQVRRMGVIQGNRIAHDNKWEEITKGGDPAIKRWIDDEMVGKSVVVVLIGAETAGRPWIEYEIEKGWNDGKGVMGVRIHDLKDIRGSTSLEGRNPFDGITVIGREIACKGVFGEAQGIVTSAPKRSIIPKRNAVFGLDRIAPSPEREPVGLFPSGGSSATKHFGVFSRAFGENTGVGLTDAVQNKLDLGKVVTVHYSRVSAWGGKTAYNNIRENLADWIEDAIENRKKYTCSSE